MLFAKNIIFIDLRFGVGPFSFLQMKTWVAERKNGVSPLKSWRYPVETVQTRKRFIGRKATWVIPYFRALSLDTGILVFFKDLFSLDSYAVRSKPQVGRSHPAIASFCLPGAWKRVAIKRTTTVLGAQLYNCLPHVCWPPPLKGIDGHAV